MRLPLLLGARGSLGRRLIGALLGSAGVRIVGIAMSFLVGVQLARYLGPAEYGIYGTVMALVSILTVPAQFGLPQLLTREVSACTARRDLDGVKGSLIWFTLIVTAGSVVMAVVGLAGLVLWPANLGPRFAHAYHWGLASIPLLALASLGVSALRGFHRVVGAQIYDAVIRPALFACLLLAAIVGAGVLDAATALTLQALASVVTLAACAWTLRQCLPPKLKDAKAAARTGAWASSAIPMMGTEILRVLDGQYAVLLLGMLVSLHDVGVFRVALAIAPFVGLPSTIVNLVVMPYVAQLHADGDRRRLQQIATGSALAMLATTLTITFAIALFGEPLLALVFGDAYRPAFWPLVLIGLAFSVNGFFGSTATLLNMCGNERAVTLAYATGLGFGAALTMLLVGKFGILSAALGMIASEIVKGSIMWTVAVRSMTIDTAATSAFWPTTACTGLQAAGGTTER